MPLAGMSSAELAALREAYADAEEWMLEGVCASLDGLRGDRAGVRETLGSVSYTHLTLPTILLV